MHTRRLLSLLGCPAVVGLATASIAYWSSGWLESLFPDADTAIAILFVSTADWNLLSAIGLVGALIVMGSRVTFRRGVQLVFALILANVVAAGLDAQKGWPLYDPFVASPAAFSLVSAVGGARWRRPQRPRRALVGLTSAALVSGAAVLILILADELPADLDLLLYLELPLVSFFIIMQFVHDEDVFGLKRRAVHEQTTQSV